MLGLPSKTAYFVYISVYSYIDIYFCAFVCVCVNITKFPKAVITNYHKLSNLKPQKCILPQFYKSEVQNQGIGRAMLPPKVLGENPPLPFPASGTSMCSLARSCTTPISDSKFTWSPPLSPLGVFYKDICHWI